MLDVFLLSTTGQWRDRSHLIEPMFAPLAVRVAPLLIYCRPRRPFGSVRADRRSNVQNFIVKVFNLILVESSGGSRHGLGWA